MLYRFKVVSFGLQSSCSVLVHALYSIMNKHEKFIDCYVEDILVFSADEDSHMKYIKILFKELPTYSRFENKFREIPGLPKENNIFRIQNR